VVVFGGSRRGQWQNSTHVLDTDTWTWSTPPVRGVAPPGRAFHSATVVGAKRRSIVVIGGNNRDDIFGGADVAVLTLSGGGGGGGSSDELAWVWSHPKTSGGGPCGRAGHVAALVDDGRGTLLVQGGWDTQAASGDLEFFPDTWLLDTESWAWRELKTAAATDGRGGARAPPKRTGHRFVTLGGGTEESEGQLGGGASALGKEDARVILFGGQDDDDVRHHDLVQLVLPAAS